MRYLFTIQLLAFTILIVGCVPYIAVNALTAVVVGWPTEFYKPNYGEGFLHASQRGGSCDSLYIPYQGIYIAARLGRGRTEANESNGIVGVDLRVRVPSGKTAQFSKDHVNLVVTENGSERIVSVALKSFGSEDVSKIELRGETRGSIPFGPDLFAWKIYYIGGNGTLGIHKDIELRIPPIVVNEILGKEIRVSFTLTTEVGNILGCSL